MKDKKVILYVLLGMIVFALWNAWQKDYYEEPQTQQNTAIVDNIPGVPVIPATTKEAVVASASPLTITVAQIPESRLIKVSTDVLDLAIDTVGGNIVSASLLKYPNVIYQEHPINLLNNSAGKYYVAQSGLISKQGPDLVDGQAHYSSVQQEYKLQPKRNCLEVKLRWVGADGLSVTKAFLFTRGKYDFAVNYEIVNKTPQLWTGQYYAQIKRARVDTKSGLFQVNTYTGASISSAETPYEKVSFSKIEEIAKDKAGFIRDSKGGWVAMQQRYFLSTWVPEQDKTYRYFGNFNNGIYTIGISDNTVVPSGQKATITSTFYVGPEITENLTPLAKGLDHTVDYGWLWPIAIVFFWILKKLYEIVGNWGWAIILITVLIKLVFYKLSESSCRSMAKMRALMPKMQALKERYGDDKQKLHQATMDLYKQEKINPLNLGGCLPMLIQIPFFIALYYVLMGAVELRHAPFVFWLHDLSAKDPYYILPVLMGVSMFLQQRLNPTSADPAQEKMMMLMPIVFTAFFLNFPSGLVLYWLVSNVLSILQQWYINKRLAAVPASSKKHKKHK
jgi:YidC/Oxa1 family membrane protein insertase